MVSYLGSLYGINQITKMILGREAVIAFPERRGALCSGCADPRSVEMRCKVTHTPSVGWLLSLRGSCGYDYGCNEYRNNLLAKLVWHQSILFLSRTPSESHMYQCLQRACCISNHYKMKGGSFGSSFRFGADLIFGREETQRK